MEFKFSADGTLELFEGSKKLIARSPIGMIIKNGELAGPVSAEINNDKIVLDFGKDNATLKKETRKNGSIKLTVTDISDSIDHFIFGAYRCPMAKKCGEILGAAWNDDGSVVCIQSLNPKTTGELEVEFTNNTDFPSPCNWAAGVCNGETLLSCSAANMTRPRKIKTLFGCGLEDVIAEPVPLPDGSIVGASVILTYAESAEMLLEQISDIEVEEHLPHPTIDGEWTKTSMKTTDIYFVFDNSNADFQVRTAEKAGVTGIYFSDPFKSWGHFEINKKRYPGGEKEFAEAIKNARDHGVNVGFHTLSNFIHVHDPYVTPVPHKELLAYDPTEITKSISADDTEIFIKEELNYAKHLTLGCVRIGDELIQFKSFDKDRLCLTGCKRGAFKTVASAHEKGETITHLADHGYGTLFPSMKLQGEMADKIGELIRDNKIRRMSFDGMEGCFYTGNGEYGASEYVRRVFEKAGNELICDASGGTHYRWHAHSYFNWGEPWYDYQLTGGMYNYRVHNQEYFRRNLIPGMLGWFVINDHRLRFEPTLPETLEYILSRMIAHNAGLCINVNVGESEKLDSYLETIRLWQEFRHTVNVPDEIRELMKDKNSRWHLENKDGKWILSKLDIANTDLGYCDMALTMESGTTGYAPVITETGENVQPHKTSIVFDRNVPTEDLPAIIEPLHCRIRVGTPLDKGELHDLTFSEGWFGPKDYITFKVTAKAGEYLEYKGGKTLYRYDADYNLIETVEGEGIEVNVNGSNICGVCVGYKTTGDDMRVMFDHIRTERRFEFPIK